MSVFRSIQRIALILSAAGIWILSVTGQSPYDPVYSPEAFLIRDQLVMFTDRSIYVAGEQIQFRADHHTIGVSEGRQWSSVIYLELVTPEGHAVSQGKFFLEEGRSTGILHIPEGVISGNYFLKSYTRWMRNSGPRAYSYTPLKIINPFHAEVTHSTQEGLSGQVASRSEYLTGHLQCTTGKLVYKRGEEVELRLYETLDSLMQSINCCVTVVPAGGIDTDKGQFQLSGSPIDPKEYRVNHLPDLNGVALTGSLIHKGPVSYPFPSARLYFALLGERPDFLTAVTDDHGRFVLSTPDRTGLQEFFVAPDPLLLGQVKVLIDQEFDTEKPPIQVNDFALTDREQMLATRMALHQQFASVYGSDRILTAPEQDNITQSESPFYGTQGTTLQMGDFVTLPTLEEVFINLVPEVEIERKQGKGELKVIGQNSALNLYLPLILVDHIPVFDHQVVLEMQPDKIEKIDVINDVYVKGYIPHGGVISIFSRNGDMAGIDLSAESYFFDYQAIQPAYTKVIPEYDPGDRIPDSRNTLLWVEEVELQKGETRELQFKAPVVPGEYVVLVRGANRGGSVLSAISRFTVK